jgi:hypothetical protein
LAESVEAVRIRPRRVGLESERGPDRRLHVRAYDDTLGLDLDRRANLPRSYTGAENAASVGSVRGRSEGDSPGRMKPTYHVQLRAWLLLRAAIRFRSEGRAEPVVAHMPLVVLRHPDVAHRMGFEPGSPGLAAAECFLERRGYVRPVSVGPELRAFLVTDAGRTWLEQDHWASPWWRRVFRF